MCDTPITIELQKPKYNPETNELIDKIDVSCGKCPPCKKTRVNQWAYRLKKEMDRSVTGHFVTLTYNHANLPFTKKGLRTLKKRDLQLFMKRLRKNHEKKKKKKLVWWKLGDIYQHKIKYYAVGEYGTERGRPHYHLIIFNSHPQDIREAWMLDGKEIGTVHIDEVNTNTIVYTLKYMKKEQEVYNREKPFSLQSRGLGENHLTPNMERWHRSDPNNAYVLLDQNKVPIPKYYTRKIYTTEEEKRKNIFDQRKRIKLAEEKKKKEWEATNDTIPTFEEKKRHEATSRYNKSKTEKPRNIS